MRLSFRIGGTLYFVGLGLFSFFCAAALPQIKSGSPPTQSESVTLTATAIVPALFGLACLWGAVWIATGRVNPFRVRH